MPCSSATRAIATAQYEKAIQSAFKDVADALAQRATIGEQTAAQQDLVTASQDASRLADARKALTANENAYRIARLRYEGQLSTYQSVLLAEQSVLAQRRIVADLESRALALDVALVRALGGGFAGA